MKITHIALCGPVTDNLSYQDNLLPKYHKKLGYEVSMITSKYIWSNDGNIIIDSRDVYMNEYEIKTIRLNKKRNFLFSSRFKKFDNIYETIEKEAPDILFIHGVQFLDIKEIVNYAKNFPNVEIYVDNHADYSNSVTHWFSKNISHKIIWKYYAQLIEPYVKMFYGVLPARVDFLIEMYDIPKEKTELLIMGADDEKIIEYNTSQVRNKTRTDLGITADDFVIVTGGKIDKAKLQVLNLMKAVSKVNNSNVKLIVYGSVIPEMKKKVQELCKHESIKYIGWIDSNESYKMFSASDLVIFPGRHSVYWEQVVAQGRPLIVKHWEGTNHIDIGGNCIYLYEDSEEEISNILKKVFRNDLIYNELLQNAQHNKRKEFLYSEIAKKSIK